MVKKFLCNMIQLKKIHAILTFLYSGTIFLTKDLSRLSVRGAETYNF